MYEKAFFEKKICVRVRELRKFLRLVSKTYSHTYQIHRELGVVYIDAMCEDNEKIYLHRIDIESPRHVSSALRWDEHGFPYELERYKVQEQEVEVKLYRRCEGRELQSMIAFLEDVAREYEHSPVPPDGWGEMESVKDFMEKFQQYIMSLAASHDALTNIAKRAIVTATGFDFWEEPSVDWTESVIANYLLEYIRANINTYNETRVQAEKERHQIFHDLEHDIVNQYIKIGKLEKAGFKQGFVVVPTEIENKEEDKDEASAH